MAEAAGKGGAPTRAKQSGAIEHLIELMACGCKHPPVSRSKEATLQGQCHVDSGSGRRLCVRNVLMLCQSLQSITITLALTHQRIQFGTDAGPAMQVDHSLRTVEAHGDGVKPASPLVVISGRKLQVRPVDVAGAIAALFGVWAID